MNDQNVLRHYFFVSPVCAIDWSIGFIFMIIIIEIIKDDRFVNGVKVEIVSNRCYTDNVVNIFETIVLLVSGCVPGRDCVA